MFEWIIAFCIATDLQGSPVNRCFMLDSIVRFQTKEECEVAAQERIDWVMRQLILKHPDASPVVTGVCGKSEKGI